MATILLLVVSALGQMPLFKRYYLSDMPGLGWTADYLAVYHLHYGAAIVMAFLIPLGISRGFFAGGEQGADSAALRAVNIVFALFFGGVIVKIAAGSLGSTLPQTAAVMINMAHLALTFIFILVSPPLWFARRAALRRGPIADDDMVN
jgi:hypothetical protein